MAVHSPGPRWMVISSGQSICKAPPTPETKAWQVDKLPHSSVTVRMTGIFEEPTNSSHVNVVSDKLRVTAPQLSKLPLSISSGEIVTLVELPKSRVIFWHIAVGGV